MINQTCLNVISAEDSFRLHYPTMNSVLQVNLSPGPCPHNCDNFETYILPNLSAASGLVIDDEWHMKALLPTCTTIPKALWQCFC